MDTNLDEIYAVFGELVAAQGVNMKRQQARIAELEEKLMLSQRQVEKLEVTENNGGE